MLIHVFISRLFGAKLIFTIRSIRWFAMPDNNKYSEGNANILCKGTWHCRVNNERLKWALEVTKCGKWNHLLQMLYLFEVRKIQTWENGTFVKFFIWCTFSKLILYKPREIAWSSTVPFYRLRLSQKPFSIKTHQFSIRKVQFCIIKSTKMFKHYN